MALPKELRSLLWYFLCVTDGGFYIASCLYSNYNLRNSLLRNMHWTSLEFAVLNFLVVIINFYESLQSFKFITFFHHKLAHPLKYFGKYKKKKNGKGKSCIVNSHKKRLMCWCFSIELTICIHFFCCLLKDGGGGQGGSFPCYSIFYPHVFFNSYTIVSGLLKHHPI